MSAKNALWCWLVNDSSLCEPFLGASLVRLFIWWEWYVLDVERKNEKMCVRHRRKRLEQPWTTNRPTTKCYNSWTIIVPADSRNTCRALWVQCATQKSFLRNTLPYFFVVRATCSAGLFGESFFSVQPHHDLWRVQQLTHPNSTPWKCEWRQKFLRANTFSKCPDDWKEQDAFHIKCAMNVFQFSQFSQLLANVGWFFSFSKIVKCSQKIEATIFAFAVTQNTQLTVVQCFWVNIETIDVCKMI